MLMKWLICIVLYIYPGLAQSSEADDSIPCESGWFYFRDKCYKLGGKKEYERLKREQAAAKCVTEGGQLVTIGSQEVQEFLVTFLLLDAKTSIWIGLHDKINESNYSWDDDSIVNYTNWMSNEPSGPEREHEDCVEMVFVYSRPHYEVGQWNDNSCSVRNAYICEAETSNKSSPDPRLCTSGGWKYQNTCYHVIFENKSWDDAEHHCQNMYNGHLITILEHTVDLFIQYIQSKTDRDLWIGIKIQEQSFQQWISGWYVGYSEWENDEAEDFVLGTCSLRSKRHKWKKVQCSNKKSFICEAPSVRAPPWKQPVKSSQCPQLLKDWWDLGGEYCYFVDMKSKVNWYKANMECIRRGGSLVSIHSEEESALLHPFIQYTQPSVHIGLLRSKANENLFMWTDGSRLNYKNWNRNEPNRRNEKCGEMYTGNMKWNDGTCNSEFGYICSVRKVSPNVTQQIERNNSTISPKVTQQNCTLSPVVTQLIERKNCTLSPRVYQQIGQNDCACSLSFKVVMSLLVCILLLVILLGCVIYCYRTRGLQRSNFSVDLQPIIPSS